VRYGYTSPFPGGPARPPLAIALHLRTEVAGALEVDALGLRDGRTRALGMARVDVAPGAHARVALMLQPIAAATCADGYADGSESDVDCGGSCPMRCADGRACARGTDCASGVCLGDGCAVPGCRDTVKNGSESDVDCGGACEARCGDGRACGQDRDC